MTTQMKAKCEHPENRVPSQVGFWTYSHLNGLQLHNHRFYQRFSLYFFPIRLEHWLELIHANDVDTVTRALHSHPLGPSETLTLCYRIRDRWGEYHWIKSTSMALNNEGDIITGNHHLADSST